VGRAEIALERRAAVALIVVGIAVLVAGGAYVRSSAWHQLDPQLSSGPDPADTLPPLLPPVGTRDSLIALVAAPAALLERFETKETDYESKAIAVYGRVRDYYLVGTAAGGRAWLRERETGAAHPIEQLLINRLNYLTPSWDMSVRDSAGAHHPSRAVSIPRDHDGEYPGKVLEFARRPDGVWIHVEVFSESPCEGGTPKTVTTGWIPLYGPDAKPTVWFYSRGC
jgi:hypothetical protein